MSKLEDLPKQEDTEHIKSDYSFNELHEMLQNACKGRNALNSANYTQIHAFLCLFEEIKELKQEIKRLKENGGIK
ncbi:hypothetical protein [Chondrinema litorale]|uniref:hypothetical protein n=1 Tax=Chondrinema litorale TaxID=2994555 RepID=UPI002543C1BC|nr:hypothetical protein [Chondrinema litorale]UZS00249.1 hypothetical protein OQ292_40625 [Chondrinema litorale]